MRSKCKAIPFTALHQQGPKLLNKLNVTRNDDEISASPRNIGIYMIIFEKNCNNLKMATIGRNT